MFVVALTILSTQLDMYGSNVYTPRKAGPDMKELMRKYGDFGNNMDY
jgi:hypothetical protein